MSNEHYAHDPDHTENRKLYKAGVEAFGEEAERKHWEFVHAFRLHEEENPNWWPLNSDGPHWVKETEYRRRADAPAIPGNDRYANTHDPNHIVNRKLFAEGASAFGEEAERAHWECVPIHRLRVEQTPNWSPLSSDGPNWFLGTAYRRRADAPTIPQKEPIGVEIEIEIDHTLNRKLFAQGVDAFGEEAERKHWESVDAYELRTKKNPRWTQLGGDGPHWFFNLAYRRRADAPAIPDLQTEKADPGVSEQPTLLWHEAPKDARYCHLPFGEENRPRWIFAENVDPKFLREHTGEIEARPPAEWFERTHYQWFEQKFRSLFIKPHSLTAVETSEESKLAAWRLIADHPFFEGCLDDAATHSTPLVEAMLGRLDRASEGFVTLASKYADTLSPFVNRMVQELYANSGKGDRPGWRLMSAEDAVLELHYHVGKLQKAALKEGNQDAIFEYAADVANIAMMVADVGGCLGEPKPESAEESAVFSITRTSVLSAVEKARNRGASDDTIKRVLGGFSKGEATGPPESHVTHMSPKDFATVISLLNAL